MDQNTPAKESYSEDGSYLIVPIYSDNKNGMLHIIRGNSALSDFNTKTRKFIVVEEGLFLLGAVEMTAAQLKEKYDVTLPNWY